MDEDRPYAPSARKLARARASGDVPRSALVSAAFVLIGGGLAVAFTGSAWLSAWRAFAVRALAGEGELADAGRLVVLGAAPPAAAAFLLAALGGFLQVGPLFTAKPLRLDLSRLDPVDGLRRMFRPEEVVSRVVPVLLLIALLAIAATVLRGSIGLLGRPALSAGAALERSSEAVAVFYLRACMLMAVAGAVALIYRRYRYWRDQHMSRREVLRERRESYGDPAARRQRERRHRELTAAPTLDRVLETATLVVVGDEVAVVLGWQDRLRPPRVCYLARGRERWIGLSAFSARGVPVAADDALARELSPLRVGAEVPRGTWRRIARLIARGAEVGV